MNQRYDVDLLNQWAEYSDGQVIDVMSVSVLENVVFARTFTNMLHEDGKASSVALELTASQLTVQQMAEKILTHLNEIERLIQTARERRNTADSDS